ncbi:hypothetical protein GGR56DRAFT_682139 [Xylariaceae sp. FL0804]|nr:hypothetical protein GGR56DRAFT_682139 [Xylariaceae sp. FL0804]
MDRPDGTKPAEPSDGCASSSLRTSSSSSNSNAPQPGDQPPSASPRRPSRRTLVVLLLGAAGAAAAAALGLRGPDAGRDALNGSTFSAFTIAAREQVSPTAFVLQVRPAAGAAEAAETSAARIADAWRHGLWSVEIKQPQLQIARHYTPLPPTTTATQQNEEAEVGPGGPESSLLRFLIRRMDGGEMSSYLARLRVGDTVWLRGPHPGFDARRRLGAARDVVFLAGGTGVAPALQVARRLLDHDDDNGDGGGGAEEKPVVSILWANRRGVDALGRQEKTTARAPTTWWWSWSGLWSGGGGGGGGAIGADEEKACGTGVEAGKSLPSSSSSSSSLGQQIADLQKRHGEHFRVSYFVDEEGSFIGARDIAAATRRRRPPPRAHSAAVSPRPLVPPTPSCAWHGAAAVATLPDDNDAQRQAGGIACTCVRSGSGLADHAGARLLFVSGPDGFVEALAGRKRWHAAGEMQGPVAGLLGRLGRDDPALMDGWLVLKL